MVYYPDGVAPNNYGNVYNSALISIFIIAGIFTLVVGLTLFYVINPDPINKFVKWVRRILGYDKVVKTVYSDKSKNFSETEFLPIPMKAPTESLSYEFLGWNKFAKDKDGNFVTEPIFLKKVKTCIVNVYDEKDRLLETHEVEYGAGIKIAHKKIIKEASKEFEYEIVGWDKETKAFFENTEIRPVFKAKPIKYDYKFVMDDGKTVVYEKKSISGTPINCPIAPAKIDDEYIYEFVGWKNYRRGMILDKNYVFEAIFEKKVAKSQEEKLSSQKSAIEIAVNEYKTKNKKTKKDNLNLVDNQRYVSPKRIEIEKNKKPAEKKNAKDNESKAPEKNIKTILGGVVVEKNNQKRKSKTN